MPETSVTNKSTFFEFTPITLTQMDQVEAIRTASGSTLYVYTFASLFSWREAERYSIYISDDAFLIKYGARGENAYLFPCGSLAGKQRMIDALLQHEPPTFYYVSDDDKLFLEGMYPGRFDFTACRNDYPYLYDKDAQIELAGKDYKGLRHKVNQGRAVARAWSSEPLTAENTDRARAITRKWAEGRTADDPTDVPAVEAALDSFSFLPVWGVLFMADGEDIAYVLGTFITPEIFDICFCKVLDKRCDYYIKWELYRILPCQVKTVDSEEDMGLEGLRTHKLLRRPKELIRVWKGDAR